jgi:hypothetical protein
VAHGCAGSANLLVIFLLDVANLLIHDEAPDQSVCRAGARRPRAKLRDPLVRLAEHVAFKALAAGSDAAAPRSSRAKGSRPSYPTVLMIRILVLQQLYNPADDALKYQLLDDAAFCVSGSDREQQRPQSQDDLAVLRPSGPGWRRQSGIRAGPATADVAGLLGALRTDHRRLADAGPGSEQQAGGRRNGRGRDDADGLESAQARAEDVDAKWTRKLGKNHFGYKLRCTGMVDRLNQVHLEFFPLGRVFDSRGFGGGAVDCNTRGCSQ